MYNNDNYYGSRSPGGFVFGIQGWVWQPPKVSGITFFLDNTAKVSDQYGRPIKGTIIDGKEVLFAQGPPDDNEGPNARKKFANHSQVIKALAAEHVKWNEITWSGWPQIPYDELKKMTEMPWPFDDEHTTNKKGGCACIRCCIKDPQLRKDAIRLRREQEEKIAEELGWTDDEEVESTPVKQQPQPQGKK